VAYGLFLIGADFRDPFFAGRLFAARTAMAGLGIELGILGHIDRKAGTELGQQRLHGPLDHLRFLRFKRGKLPMCWLRWHGRRRFLPAGPRKLPADGQGRDQTRREHRLNEPFVLLHSHSFDKSAKRTKAAGYNDIDTWQQDEQQRKRMQAAVCNLNSAI
jgi:hypothetical protein